jgi:glutamate/tyrosine decarboxylase-like PLP-dependent enzyme
VCAVVLIIGLIQAVTGKKKPKRNKRTLAATTSQKMSQNRVATNQPQIPSSPATSKSVVDDQEVLDSLRKKIQEVVEPRRGSPSASRVPETESIPADQIRRQVIDAFDKGMGVPQISRKYHLSVDQVALILRITRDSPRKN